MQKMSSVFTAQAYRNSPERVGRQRSAMLNTLRLAASTASGFKARTTAFCQRQFAI